MKGPLWVARGEKKKSWHSNTRSANMGVFFFYYETLWWYASLLTGIWGFSSNPAPAVFLQKLCFHHRRGLHTVVPERTHTKRGGKVNKSGSVSWWSKSLECIKYSNLILSLLRRKTHLSKLNLYLLDDDYWCLFQLQTVQWNWSAWWAEPPWPYSNSHHHAVPGVSYAAKRL